MSAYMFTEVILKAGKLLLIGFGVLGLGALLASSASGRIPPAYRAITLIVLSAAVLGLIVWGLATVLIGRTP
jgi:hypothetical protein